MINKTQFIMNCQSITKVFNNGQNYIKIISNDLEYKLVFKSLYEIYIIIDNKIHFFNYSKCKISNSYINLLNYLFKNSYNFLKGPNFTFNPFFDYYNYMYNKIFKKSDSDSNKKLIKNEVNYTKNENVNVEKNEDEKKIYQIKNLRVSKIDYDIYDLYEDYEFSPKLKSEKKNAYKSINKINRSKKEAKNSSFKKGELREKCYFCNICKREHINERCNKIVQNVRKDKKCKIVKKRTQPNERKNIFRNFS